jgi:serine/threonine-protein kinase
MSPEQMRAEAVDERSDIWGLGAILFEMLTGRPPFIGDTLPEVYSAVLKDAPPPVDSLRAGVPPGLDDVVQRCLEKDPAQRFCDVADLAEALAPYAGSAAQSVERITRILMNPDAVRARYSLLPGGGAPTGQGGVAGPGRGASSSGILGSDQRMEGMMAGDAEGEADGEANLHPIPEAAEGSPGGTLLESDAARREGGWRPSLPPLSAEFAALSATGVRTGRAPHFSRRRRLGWFVAGAGVLGAAVLVWILAAAPDPSDSVRTDPTVSDRAPARLEVLPVAPPGAAAAGQAASQPRVTPIAPGGDKLDSTDRAAAKPAPEPAVRHQREVLALQPWPLAKPGAGSSSAPNAGRAAEGAAAPANAPASSQASRAPAPFGEAPRAAAAGRAPHGDDPWNPDSFGDRR